MNTPTFTSEPPTKPGWYLWKINTELDDPISINVSKELADLYCSKTSLSSGLWCRLVPAEEVEKAFMEAADAVSDNPLPLTIRYIWHTSRAKRVMEGEV